MNKAHQTLIQSLVNEGRAYNEDDAGEQVMLMTISRTSCKAFGGRMVLGCPQGRLVEDHTMQKSGDGRG